MNETSKKPAHTIRYGSVQLAIWASKPETWPPFRVTVERRFRNAEGQWQSSESFANHELIILAKALTDAHSWIFAQAVGERPTAASSDVPSEETAA